MVPVLPTQRPHPRFRSLPVCRNETRRSWRAMIGAADAARQAFDCRFGVPEHEWRPRTGIFRRRGGGGHHHRSVADQWLFAIARASSRRRATGGARARRAPCAGGRRAQGHRSGWDTVRAAVRAFGHREDLRGHFDETGQLAHKYKITFQTPSMLSGLYCRMRFHRGLSATHL